MKIFFRILGYSITISIAVLIFNSEMIQGVLMALTPISFLAEFVAGALYTSLITTPIAIVLLVSLSQASNIFMIAAVGGAGAVIGDLLVMSFVKKIGRNIHISDCGTGIPLVHICPKVILRVLGVLCLILPVPDEVAMSLLGVTKIRTRIFVLIVYPAKTIGIFLIAFGAGQLV